MWFVTLSIVELESRHTYIRVSNSYRSEALFGIPTKMTKKIHNFRSRGNVTLEKAKDKIVTEEAGDEKYVSFLVVCQPHRTRSISID